MVTIRRLPITLLEVLVVITILSIGSGIVAISINKALVDQRFRTEVGLIVDKMRLAQDLMLILKTDVHLNFTEKENGSGIEYWLDVETNLPDNVKREFGKNKKDKNTLKTIKGVFLVDELLKEVKEKHIDVKFFSNGAVMSKGVMRLSTTSEEASKKNALESFICLSGYPRPISSVDKEEDAKKVCLNDDSDFDGKLTQDTISRLPEKLKKLDSSNEVDKDEPKDESKGKEKESTPKEKTGEKK